MYKLHVHTPTHIHTHLKIGISDILSHWGHFIVIIKYLYSKLIMEKRVAENLFNIYNILYHILSQGLEIKWAFNEHISIG